MKWLWTSKQVLERLHFSSQEQILAAYLQKVTDDYNDVDRECSSPRHWCQNDGRSIIVKLCQNDVTSVVVVVTETIINHELLAL